MFNNLSIKMKLLTGFIVVAIIAGVVGYIGISNIKTIDDADTELYQKMDGFLVRSSDRVLFGLELLVKGKKSEK